ncbi:uncharacterized protein LOC143054747 [Mytilus galloprovincialis]|uniref:uncharacterized protein LOC143054747 n=1 Tax=Mytilus galloprovincialis TaxID=29158 RepID=UPI003F7C8A76
MKAAGEGYLEICRLLIDTGCKIDITSEYRGTALMFAAFGGRLEICKLLIDRGCKIDITSGGGETALHYAAKEGYLQITRCLVEQGGASPLFTTREGKTPYDLAAAEKKGQYKEVMEYLQTAVLRTKDSMLNKLLGNGSYQSFDMRCMVTGQFSVGKSSLVKLLVGDNVPEGRHATDGISLVEGRCGLDIETRNWIMIDPGTYKALDVVYNKVLMTSVEKDERKQTKTSGKHKSDAKLVELPNKDYIHSQKSEATKSTYFPVNLSGEPSTQPQATKSTSFPVNLSGEPTTQPQATKSTYLPVNLSDEPSTQPQSTKSTSFPLNLSGELSQQPQAAHSLSQQISSIESKKQQMKKKMTTKMTKKEMRKKMEKVLKTGKYEMKVGRLIFWDFGGQYVYYTTHQTFMTFRALFLVVFDGSKELNEEIRDVLCFPGQHMTPTPAVFLLHWVNSILTYCKVVYAGIPKILFVATHKDKVPVEDVETRRALLYSEVEELFKDHEGRNHLVLDKQIFVNATDKDDKEIESLKKAITELTFDHPCWGENMPNAWVPLELEIAEMVAAGRQILSLVELEELNSISKVSVLDFEQLHDFLHFQHSLGKMIYFHTLQLRDYVIINPLLMVEVMRSFVTDIGFWPKKRRMQVIFSRMSESGIIHREDLYQIWEQKDFRPILPYKEFIFNILIHLDILAEQRRYDTGTGSRLPVENFFVPCMVTERNTTSFMEKECTPEKAICLAFVFKGTVIPPALPNRLISACLSMWTLKQYEGRKLLFSGFIVVSFDKAHDVVICVEGNKILLYLVHKTSAGLIVPDIATGVKECLVTTMERISDFYQSTIHVKHGKQLPFHIEYSCFELKCFISEETALQISEWVCDKHKLTHRQGNWVVWNQDKIKEQCELHCPGLLDSALNQIPSDVELYRLTSGCDETTIRELAIHLGMTLQDWDTLRSDNARIEIVKYRILVNWREKYSGKFSSISKALTDMDLPVHTLCQVKRERRAETDIPLEFLDRIPTDEILDKLAPQIGQVYFQLGAAIGLSIGTLENIQSNNPRDLAAQNREVLFAWREDETVKPTIRVLVQALVNIGRGALCLQEVLKNVDLNTLGHSSDIGAIPKKPQGQKQRMSKSCAIA